MNKGLKITLITLLLIVLSPLISVSVVLSAVVLLCRKDNFERFEETLNKISNNKHWDKR